MTELLLQQVSRPISDSLSLDDVSLSLKSGELLALLGPNGVGKTSLLRTALGLAPSVAGTIMLDGEPLHALSNIARARKIGYLPQTRPLAWPNSVRDIVSLGRYAWGAGPGRLAADDREAVDDALADCTLGALADRSADTLSGGELARVHCARAFAARTPLLLADEPVASLDPRHQLRVMALFQRYVERGGGAMVVLHDISLAARYAHRLVWMIDGRVVADGPPRDTLTEDRLAEVYGVEATVTWRETLATVEIAGELNG